MRNRIANPRRGNLRVAVGASLCIAALTSIYLAMVWLRVGGAPVRVLGNDVVVADIVDYEGFPATVNGDPLGSIVAVKSDSRGNYLMVKLVVLQSFIDKHKTELTNYVKSNDIRLEGQGATMTPLLLAPGVQDEFDDGTQRATFPDWVVFRKPDGQFEVSQRQSGDPEDNLVGMVQRTQRMSSISGGSGRIGPKEWMRLPLQQRLKEINPPQVAGNVWMYEPSNESDMAWSTVEFACLFRLPAQVGEYKLVMFGDQEAAVPITVSDSSGGAAPATPS